MIVRHWGIKTFRHPSGFCLKNAHIIVYGQVGWKIRAFGRMVFSQSHRTAAVSIRRAGQSQAEESSDGGFSTGGL